MPNDERQRDYQRDPQTKFEGMGEPKTASQSDRASEPNPDVFGISAGGADLDQEQSRSATLGGILRQLRSLQEAHLSYVEAHADRLQTRLAENIDHREKILAQMNLLERQVLQLLKAEDERLSDFDLSEE